MKVLVIDDDQRIRKSLNRILKDDYIVDVAKSASEGEELAYNSYYDAIVLDMSLPDMAGDDLASLFKTKIPNTPIIAISDHCSINDKNIAFEKGVDDFLIKPINGRELKSRVKVHIRKNNPDKNETTLKVLKVRNLTLDRERKMVFYKEERLSLRKKELQILEYFMLNPNRVISRSDILEYVWEADTNPFTNTVDVHIKRLRDKLETAFGEKYFETVHGMGYIFC